MVINLNKQRSTKQMFVIALTLIGVVLGLINVFPFIFMISSSFKPSGRVFEYPLRLIPETLYLQNYKEIFSDKFDFLLWYKNTLVMTVFSVISQCIIIPLTAYSFAKLRFRGREFLFTLFLCSMMIPGDVAIVQKYMIFKSLHITNSMLCMIVPAGFNIFWVFFLRQFFRSIPAELQESAIIDGCGYFKIYVKIILPLTKPALITMVIFNFIGYWNDFVTPYLFINNMKKTMLTVGMQTFTIAKFTDYGLQMAGACLAIIPILILFISSQKYYIQGIAASGIKG